MYLEDGLTEVFSINIIAIDLYPLKEAKDMRRGVNASLITCLFQRVSSLQSNRSLSIRPSHMDRLKCSLRVA